MSQENAIANARIRSLGTRDWFLQQLVRLANESPETAGCPVTLCVKGLVVSGVLVSGRAYFREFAQAVAASVPGADRERQHYLYEYVAAFRELYPPAGETAIPGEDTEDVVNTFPEFIHLRDARVWGTPELPTSPWWRGRIAEIDGFFLGTPHPGAV